MTQRAPAKIVRTLQALKTRAAQQQELASAVIFHRLCMTHSIPLPVRQHQFAKPDRKWALDFAWPDARLGLEVEGGIWSRGKHGRGAGILKDMEKANGLAVRGWRLLRVTPDQLLTPDTLDLIRTALNVPADQMRTQP